MKKSCKNKSNGFLAYLNKGSFKKFLIVGVLSLPVVFAFNSCSKNSSIDSLASSVSSTGDTDEVIQNKTRSVDILFLVDNSYGSLMEEKLKKLNSKIRVFSSQLDSQNIDWNIAVMPTISNSKSVKLSPLRLGGKGLYYKTTGGCITPSAYVLKKKNSYKWGRKRLEGVFAPADPLCLGEVVSLKNLSNEVKQFDEESELPYPSSIKDSDSVTLPHLLTTVAPDLILSETILSVGVFKVDVALPLPNSLPSQVLRLIPHRGITSLMGFLSQKDIYPRNDFLRKNSFVSVIVISDSDEMSSYGRFPNAQEREDLLSNFVDKKVETLGAQQSFQFHSITASKDSYCGGQGLEDLRAGKAYRALSEKNIPEKGIVQGLTRNICEPDYSSILSDIVDSIASNLP